MWLLSEALPSQFYECVPNNSGEVGNQLHPYHELPMGMMPWCMLTAVWSQDNDIYITVVRAAEEGVLVA